MIIENYKFDNIIEKSISLFIQYIKNAKIFLITRP